MNKNKNQAPAFFVGAKLAFLILTGLGMTLFLAEAVGLQNHWTSLLPPVFAAAAFSGALLFFVPSKLTGVIIAVGLWFGFVCLNMTDIYGGAQKSSAIVEAVVSAYFNNEEVQKSLLSGESLEQMTAFLTAVVTAWQGGIVVLNLKKSRPALTMLVPGLMMAAYLAVGQVPYPMSLVLFGAGGIGLICLNGGSDRNYAAALQNAAVSVILFAAVTGAVVWAMPPEGYLKEEDKAHIRTAVRDSYQAFGEYLNENVLNRDKSQMGIGEGQLDQAGDLSYTGDVVMHVSTNRQVPASIYLKAYAAGSFESNRWEKAETEGLDEISAAYDANTNEFLKSIWNHSYQAAFSGSDTVMTISPTEALMPGHLYVPYAALLGSGDKMAAEGYMTGLSGGQKRKIFYSEDFFSLMSDADSYIGNGVDSGRLRSYSSYVRENYMSVDGMSEQFKNDYKTTEGSSPGNVTDYIRKRFESDGIRYTLEPGRMPRGENIIDYFLYENKKGYCMHFASAAVMIYRLNGIPARYAEGYVLPRGSFRQVSSGYENGGSPEFVSEIRDYQAHAWPEIYIEDFGWVPAEVTPAYTNGSIPEVLTQTDAETETESGESEVEASEPEESETKAAESENGDTESAHGGSGEMQDDDPDSGISKNNGKTDGSPGGFKIPAAVWQLLLAVFAAAALGGAAVGITGARIRRAEALLKPPYGRQTAAVLWRYTMRWLALCGVQSVKSGDCKAILAELSRRQSAGEYAPDADMLTYVFDQLLKASYSKKGLDDATYDKVIELYNQLAKHIYGSLGIRKKLAAVFWWHLPVKRR